MFPVHPNGKSVFYSSCVRLRRYWYIQTHWHSHTIARTWNQRIVCVKWTDLYIYVYHFVMQLRILPIYAYLIFEHTFPICYHIISKDTICLRLFSFAAPENGSIGFSQQQTKERPSINVVFIESVNLILSSFSYWEEQALRAFTLIKIHCTIYSYHLRRLIICFSSLIIHNG